MTIFDYSITLYSRELLKNMVFLKYTRGEEMDYHYLLKKNYNSWNELEYEISMLEDDKEKGEVTEQFAEIYFKLNKELYDIHKVYRRKNIPSELSESLKLEEVDHGVDGIIIRKDNKIVAYQVKFRSNGLAPTYKELSTFWTESEYADFRLIFANTKNLPKPTKKRRNQMSILIDTLENLDELFFTNVSEYVAKKNLTKRKKVKPRNYQSEIINNILNGFKSENRGKLLAACGVGKTLISKWIMEKIDSDITLFVAPSLALIKQTIEEWFNKTEETFDFIAVCSDSSVVNNIKKNDEYFLLTSDVNFPVTTDPSEIKSFIFNSDQRKKVIFSTYQSIDAIANALINVKDFSFNLAVFDESHRTAGFKNSQMFTYALDDRFIPIKKRLFMTATEKIATPKIKRYAEKAGQKIFSMDDKSNYGQTLAELNFGQAIEKKIIADYKVVVCAMEEMEIYNMLQNNSYVNIDIEDETFNTTIDNLMKQTILAKAINELNIDKVISYHSTIEEARTFIEGSKNKLNLKDVLTQASPQIKDEDLYLNYVSGQQKASKRKETLSKFEKSKYGIISNAKCLTEGVDVPAVNAVYFADPKNSTIDIIQAIGRALRKKTNEDKTAYILIPVILPPNATYFSGLRTEIFDTLYSVIQALRDQDEALADIIDEVNYQNAISGPTKGRIHPGLKDKVEVLTLNKIQIPNFEDSLQFQIGEINKEGSLKEPKLVFNGTKGERKSSIKRLFTTIGDYKLESYRDNLVLPTLNKFSKDNQILKNSFIKINNNNVSHTERLGLIEKLPKQESKLTSIGKYLLNNPSEFNNIFIQQLNRFFIVNKAENKILFPYRALLKVLQTVEYLTKFEFTWFLYPAKDTSDEAINKIVQNILEMRETYKNIDSLNNENKEKILIMLNEKFNTKLDFKDVWSSRSTAYNQFNYFKKHLLLLNNIILDSEEKLIIRIKPASKLNIQEILEQSEIIEKKAKTIKNVNEKDSIKALKSEYNDINTLKINSR